MESTFSCPYSRSDSLFSRQGAALAHLDSLPFYDVVLGTDDFVPFLFSKGGSGVLANCSLCGTETTLFFSGSSVCSSFSAEACAILQALCWSGSTNNVPLLFSSYLNFAVTSPPDPLLHLSFHLNLPGRSGRNCLLSPPVLSGYNESPDICFSHGTARLINWQTESTTRALCNPL